MTRAPVVAIDGPAASGKSSTAAAVARALGYVHIDSGALYRALTWLSVRHRTDDPATIIAIAESLHVALRPEAGWLTIHVDDLDDVEGAIRAPDVNANVSAIAAMAELRDWVNVHVRDVLHDIPGTVIDGRDIGTVVVPDAELKVFLTATAAARASRRIAQRGGVVDPGMVAAETAALDERDRRDRARQVAPLRQAPDAVVLDTTALSFGEQVRRIVELAAQRGLPATPGADSL